MKKGRIAIMLAILVIMIPIVEAQALQGPEDAAAPNISQVMLTHGPTTLVTWTTSEAANSKIQYGSTTEMNESAIKADLETAHSLTLQTLPGTTYYYKITSCDFKNNCKNTEMQNFIAGPFYVKADLPRYSRTAIIDISGTTRPGAEVSVIVNNVETRKAVIQDGTFLFKSVQLAQKNNITLKAVKGTETAEAKYQIDVDNKPPIINITMPAVVTTPTVTANIKLSEPVMLTIEHDNKTTNTTATGTTDVKIDNLQPGENIITFTAQDNAGFKSVAEERTIYDTGPPNFVNTNLNQLSPSYRQEIHAKGQVSENASITVFVNGKPQNTEPTNPDGTFSISVKLERPINYSTEKRTSLDTGISWKNKVRLEAVDAAGQKKSTEEVEIAYALCGEGTWIDVQLSNPMPDMLNPRMLIEGLQQIGIAFNYTYRGGYKATINPAEVRIKSLTFAPEFQHEYDNKLVTVSKPPVRAQRAGKPSGLGYIQINFNPLDPWVIEGETAPENATMYEKEEKLSKHREGNCIAPGFGCMKLFLELEIPFIEEIPTTGYLPTTTPMGGIKTEQRTQKTCINVEIAIDKRIPPKYIPKNFLNATSKFLGKVVENIDKVLKPIETIGQYLLYTCMAGTLLSYVPILLEKYNCQYKKVTAAAGGKGSFNEEVAAIDACTEEYGDNESGDNCETCAYWKDKRQKYERLYRQVCDRVMCPAAPSLQYYLKTKGRQTPTVVNAPNAKAAMSAYTQTTGDLLSGSSCAAWMQVNRKKDQQIQPRLLFTSQEIEDIYQQWLNHKGDSSSDKSTGKVNCAGLHPAHPECCGYEYMQEWSSACGISLLGTGLDTFNEIKESTCLAMRGVGQNEIKTTSGTSSCNRLLNSLSGFCTKDGGEPITTIPTVKMTEAKAESLGVLSSAETRDLYIVVQEQTSGGGIGLLSVGQSKGYSIKLGVIVKKLEFEQGRGGTLATSETSRLTEKLDIVEYPGAYGFQQTYFNQQLIDEFRKGGHAPASFASDLCTYAGNPPCNINGDSIYGQVVAAMGSPDKEYIIKPNEGLLNSIRCICFPTVIGYLRLWKKIIGAVQNCVNTILITGDGSAGVCQAVISKYACDLLYEILACFTQSFGSGNARVGVGGIGDVLGALSSAGSEMSRSVESRYGETGTYKAVFVEKKLVHSICMWAFTGTWDFDVSTAFDQSIEEIPLDSYSMVYPCERRFIAFNPSTKPGGLVTWAYHLGVGYAAGADSQIELHLKCSGGYKCRDIDGFEKGKCDCETEKDITILPEGLSTNVQKNDVLSQEVFYTMAGTPGEGAIRYDKAYLLYRYQDAGKQVEKKSDECTINLVGGTASVPSFCRYDPFTFSFRCQFGEAEGAIRFIRATPNYNIAIPAGSGFTLADNVNITLDIQQDHPGKEKNNKYLEYQVINSAGKTVDDNKNNLIMLATNGDYQKNIGITPAIIVKKNWFETTGGAAWKAQQWSTKNPNAITENTMIEDITFLTPTGVTSTEVNKPFALSLKYVSGKLRATIHQASLSPQLTSGGIATGLPIEGCQDIEAIKEITCTPTGTQPVFGGKLVIRLTGNPVAADETVHSHFVWKPAAATDPCNAPAEKRPIVPLKIKFIAYDADEYGQPTDQVSIDPMSAQEAILEMPFNAICATADEVKPFLVGVIRPAEEITKISELMNAMYKAETEYKQKLAGFTGPVDSLSKAETISNYLGQMITEEQTYINQIDARMQVLTDPQYSEITQTLKTLKLNISETIKTAKDIKNEIDEQIKYGKTPDLNYLSEIVRLGMPILYLAIEETMIVKQTVLTSLNKIMKVPTVTSCTDEVKPQGDAYYVCAVEGSKTSPWEPAEEIPCYGGVTKKICYKLPKQYYCDKTEFGRKYDCQARTACSDIVTDLYCPQDLACCRTTVLAELHPLEKSLNDIRAYLEKIKSPPEEVAKLKTLQTATDNEYLNKKEELIKTFKDLSDKLAEQAVEVESKSNAAPSQEGFPGNKEKAIQALGLFFALKTSLRSNAQILVNRMNNVPKAGIQELRQSVDWSVSDNEKLIAKEQTIIDLINEAIGLKIRKPVPVISTPPQDTSLLMIQVPLPPGLSSWDIWYVQNEKATRRDKTKYASNYNKQTGDLIDTIHKSDIGVGDYIVYVSWDPKEAGELYSQYNGRSEYARLTIEQSAIPAPVTEPTPAPAPVPTPQPIEQIIDPPVYLDKMDTLSWEACGAGYTEVGRFSDDNEDWAKAYEYTTMNKEKEPLVLCISDQLKAYVHLEQSPSKDYSCRYGWENKGWIRNDYDNWAIDYQGDQVKANQYLHLCISKAALDQPGYGDFAYFAFMGRLGDTSQCKDNHKFAGIFELRYMPYPANAYVKVKFGNSYSEFSPAYWGDKDTKWVGLCVKPITVKTLSGAH